MISILIPVFDYNAFALVESLEKQGLKLGIPFQIICADDASFSKKNSVNQNINSLTNAQFIEHKKKLGRVCNRQYLAEKALYDQILFLDVDVVPKNSDFLEKYIQEMRLGNYIVFGGLCYDTKTTKSSNSLRYFFGKKREEVAAKIRNRNRYKHIISSNFMFKKSVFLQINGMLTKHVGYGMDYAFGALLCANNIGVKHIDNPVIHLGVDQNDVFLKKAENSMHVIYMLHKEFQLKKYHINILKAYALMRFLKINGIVGKLLGLFDKVILKNIMGQKPILILFDMYRLGYLCRIKG